MKNVYILLVLLPLLTISCQSEDVINNMDKQMAVSEVWQADIAARTFLVEDEKEINGHYDYYPIMNKWALNFYAENTAGEVIEIFIADYKGPGEYTSGKNGNENFMYYATKGQRNPDGSIPDWWSGESNSAGLDSLEDSGTVTITSQTSTYIEGTFSFKGYNSPENFVTVQEGKFKIAVSKEEQPATDVVSEYFVAEFDKRAFVVDDNNNIQGRYVLNSA